METMVNQNSRPMIKKDNLKAAKLLLLPLTLGMIMFYSLDKSLGIYLVGQICGALFFMQAFILLHEFGHRSMFRSNKWNSLFGHFFSFFVFIPYYNWLEVHELHHKWTGYRDLDPTTEKTFADRFTSKQEKIINFCWKYSVPLFTLGYRLGIYWKAEKLKRHLSDESYKKCILSMIIYAVIYIALVFMFPLTILKLLPAMYVSFILCDILSMSQHSHIAMPVSNGESVTPLNYADQVQYSRSLIFPDFLSKYVLFYFNFHEAHHAYPGLPCYHLQKMNIKGDNSFQFIPWIKKVKSMPGVDFVFKSDPNRRGF